MTKLIYDTETSIVAEQFAIIYAPKKSRKRFPENCVTIVSSEQVAIQQSNVGKKYYPARVLGPSRSSEGLMLYYLVDWLTNDCPD